MDHIIWTPWDRYCWRRLLDMEHKKSQNTIGFGFFMKAAVRKGLSTVWAFFCGSHVEENGDECWSWRTNFISRPRIFGMHSTWMQAGTKSLLINTEKCSNQEFLLEQLEDYHGGKNLTQKTEAWSNDMEGHAQKCVERYCELADKRTAVSTKSQSPCLDGHHLKKEALEPVGELSKVCSQKLSFNACTWHVFVDLTFFGQRTNLLDQSPNGPQLVTNDWIVWFHTFTTQVTTDNGVMWETRLSNVDWVYSKTQILLATVRNQNQLRVESSVFSEVVDSSPSAGGARNKRQYLTVLQNQKLFRWILV